LIFAHNVDDFNDQKHHVDSKTALFTSITYSSLMPHIVKQRQMMQKKIMVVANYARTSVG